MVIAKEVELINKSLVDLYGIDTFSSKPIFRIVWSNEQFEKRLMDYTDAGVHLLYPEVREVPKYRNWCPNRYILERLVVVPNQQTIDLAGVMVSYEPIWTYEDKHGNYLPPTILTAKFIIDTTLTAQAVQKSFITGNEKIDRLTVRYSDPDNTEEAAMLHKQQRVDGLINELFGDESSLEGATIDCGTASFVPHNYEKRQQ